MPFPYDKYPWLNFQELNLAYFIKHFREIFQQWDQLYHDLTDWKEATDQDLANWKAATEAGLQSWKTGLTESLETWKSQTATDISGWETATLAALDAWKTATTAVFEEIRVQAAGSATAADTARAAAISAQTAAEQAAAEISAELAQIQTNTSDIADLKNLTIVTEEADITTDILNTLTWTSGYMGTNGSTGTSSNLRYSNKISVSKGDVLDILPTKSDFRYVCVFDGDTPVSASGAENVDTYTVPDGIDGIVITTYIPTSSYAPTAINYTTKKYTSKNIYENDIEELTAQIDTIKEAVTVETYTDDVVSDSVTEMTSGGVGVNGAILAYNDFEYTQKVAVTEGAIVEALSNDSQKRLRWVCAYTGNTVIPASGSNADAYEFVVPAGIDGVIVTVRKTDNVDTIRVTASAEKMSAYVKPIPLGFMAESGSLSSGDKLTLPYMQVKLYNRIVFNANVINFSSIFYSMGAVKVEVDSTNLLITDGSGTALTPVPHSLTIGKNITLIIENETEEYISHVRICSDGDVFDYASKFYAPSVNAAQYVQSSGSTLTECVLSWVSQNINAPIWVFGDSYLSLYDVRWTYYLIQDGYTKNVMLNGYAGQASATDYNALVNLLKTTTPKMVVWCLGMNDPDTSDAVNESWKTIYDKVIERQKEYGFELILYTVPTTPTMNNRFKDAIVRESGYRYIEADKAVRINDNGDWISGTLNSDNVHPTETGAKILYNRILADLPEIMCNR